MDKKPPKPYPDFPLFPHATKRWAKKIRGKLHYFGPWGDPDGALAKYLDQRADLQAGRTPKLTPGDTSGFTVRELANRFLTSKQRLMTSGELSHRMFADYHAVCSRLLEELGRDRLVSDLTPDDFDRLRASFADGVSPVTLANLVRRTRTVFKFAFDSDLIEKPLKMGPAFKPPSQKVLRADRQSKPLKLFEAADLRRIIDAAKPSLKAMVLLAVNVGLGNTDISRLPQSAIDWKSGWLNYPRPKTAVPRRAKLWPETLQALRVAIDQRPNPKREEWAGLVFLTKYGVPFVRTGSAGGPIDGVSQEFAKLVKSLGISRQNLTFYGIRHTVETIGSEVRDQHALDAVMGHAARSDDMSAVYRERIDDKRIEAITDHLHQWLFPKKKRAAKKTARKG